MQRDYRVKIVEEALDRKIPYAKYTGEDGYKYFVRFVREMNRFKLTCKKSSEPICGYFTIANLPDALKVSDDLVVELKNIWDHYNKG
jgi:hypothetical protein